MASNRDDYARSISNGTGEVRAWARWAENQVGCEAKREFPLVEYCYDVVVAVSLASSITSYLIRLLRSLLVLLVSQRGPSLAKISHLARYGP